MRKCKFLLYISFNLIVSSCVLCSSYDSILEIGLYGGITLNEHRADFYQLPRFPNYGPVYNSSNSLGFFFGISSDYKIVNFLSIGLNAGILPISTEFNTKEFIGNQELDGTLVHVYSHHTFIPELTMLNLFPNLKIYPFKRFDLFLSFGVNLGLFIENNASQIEYIENELYEKGIEFTDGNNAGQFRNVFSGPMIINNSIFSMSPGFGYKFNINERLKIGLNGNLNIWMMNITPQSKWNLISSELALNLSYSVFGNEIIEYNISPEVEEEGHEPEIIADKSDGFVDKIHENQPIQEPEPKQEKALKKECCYIIFFFNEDKQKIQELLIKFEENNLHGLTISEYIDPNDEITYYRLRSKCFSDPKQALSYYLDVMLNSKFNYPISNYYIKCNE